MRKNDYFIDVSAYQTDTLVNEKQASGTDKTFIKVSEGDSWLSPVAQKQSENSSLLVIIILRGLGVILNRQKKKPYSLLITYLIRKYLI